MQWDLLEPGIELCINLNAGALLSETPRFTKGRGRANEYGPINMPCQQHVVQYMANNIETHARHAETDQMSFWTENPNTFIHLHRVLEAS